MGKREEFIFSRLPRASQRSALGYDGFAPPGRKAEQ
jgi:hypothetical protein